MGHVLDKEAGKTGLHFPRSCKIRIRIRASLGILQSPDVENISAVLFSDGGTITKFNCMGGDTRIRLPFSNHGKIGSAAFHPK